MFMLALLEFGSIALMLAVLLLAGTAQSFAFADFAKAGAGLASGWQVAIGMLLLAVVTSILTALYAFQQKDWAGVQRHIPALESGARSPWERSALRS